MKKLWTKVIAMMLSVAFTLSPILPNVAYAVTSDQLIPTTPTNSPYTVDDERFGEADDGYTPPDTDQTKQIVSEDETARTEYRKEFLMSDGSKMLVLYPEAVHYEKNDHWVEIDNSLKLSRDNSMYMNAAGSWNVVLPSSYTA